MAYLIDSNVLIAAKNLYYGMDFCPGFWDWLLSSHGQNKVFSVAKVKDEVISGEDELVVWVKALPAGFFLQPQQSDVNALQKISSWVTSGEFDQAAVTQFLQIADYYLCAQALAGDYTVVTHEVPSDGRKRVKIPNVCIAMGIDFINTFDMLRREQARFVI